MRSDSASKWEGVIANVQRRYNETESDSVRIQLDEFMQARPCTTCEGRRLKAESLAVTIADKNIGEVTEFPITGALNFFESIPVRNGSGVGLDAEIAGPRHPFVHFIQAKDISCANRVVGKASFQQAPPFAFFDVPGDDVHR